MNMDDINIVKAIRMASEKGISLEVGRLKFIFYIKAKSEGKVLAKTIGQSLDEAMEKMCNTLGNLNND